MDTTIVIHPDCEVTLYTLSLIRLTATLWERPDIKKKVKNYFSDGCIKKFGYVKNSWNLKIWHDITREVINLVDTFNDLLLPVIVAEIKDAILNMGTKMYDWMWHMIEEHMPFSDQIFWTPLGFVDEVKIFKHVWENDSSLYEGNKIFLLACLYTQEEFVEKHLDEMIHKSKMLPMQLEVEDCFDKVYGVISTYLSYYIYENYVNRKIGTKEFKLFITLDDPVVLRNYLKGTVSHGILAPPHIMIQLCAVSDLVYGVKYYYEKLTDLPEKEAAFAWIKYYCRNKLNLGKSKDGNSYDGKAKEILVYLNCSEQNWTDQRLSSLLLYVCPLESFFWSYFKKLNNFMLSGFVKYFCHMIINDYDSGLPANRNLYQKLLKEIWVRAKNIKMPRIKESIIKCFIYLSVQIQDFTILKNFLQRCEFDSADFQRYLRLADEEVNDACKKTGMRSFDLHNKFYKELFDSSDDRLIFFTEQFCKSSLLIDGNFDQWENLYRGLNIVNVPLRDFIAPVKCLAALAERALIGRCDHFIKFWHESKEDQEDLKSKFKTSSYFPACIYKFWVGKIPGWLSRSPAIISYRLLNFFFGSEDDINQYKIDKLSIFGLLDASLCNGEVRESCYSWRTNQFYSKIDEFINFYKITPEMVTNAKAEIREKIEEIMLAHLTYRNIQTLDFLMNWISLTAVEKKELFRKLYESSKIFNLCVEMLDQRGETESDTFYNVWLKLCGNICELKSGLLLFCEGEKSEEFISELRLIYEKLERGQHLAEEDFYFIWSKCNR